MKVIAFTRSKLFFSVAKLTCSELDFSILRAYKKEVLNRFLETQDINLVLIDCDTFRPGNFNIQEYIQNFNKNTYCLIIETSIHEIDKDALLAQISKQCMLQDMYIFQQFVKIFYNYYWKESEKKINQHIEDFIPLEDNQETEEEPINYDELFTVDENGIAIIKEPNRDFSEESIVLGFGKKTETLEEKYPGLEPVSIKIIEYLKKNLNKPVSITNLCTHTWGENNISKRNAIYVYIRKIRIYIKDNLEYPTKLVKSNKGFYTLKEI